MLLVAIEEGEGKHKSKHTKKQSEEDEQDGLIFDTENEPPFQSMTKKTRITTTTTLRP